MGIVRSSSHCICCTPLIRPTISSPQPRPLANFIYFTFERLNARLLFIDFVLQGATFNNVLFRFFINLFYWTTIQNLFDRFLVRIFFRIVIWVFSGMVPVGLTILALGSWWWIALIFVIKRLVGSTYHAVLQLPTCRTSVGQLGFWAAGTDSDANIDAVFLDKGAYVTAAIRVTTAFFLLLIRTMVWWFGATSRLELKDRRRWYRTHRKFAQTVTTDVTFTVSRNGA